MSPRLRKFIGLFAMLAFLSAYVIVAVHIADHVPKQWAIQLAYNLVVGIAWGLPIFPLISWMNRGR